MDVITLECPNCGANCQPKEGEQQSICEYCGTQIVLDVQESLPINREFEAKMALVQTMEQVYFQMGTNSVTHSGKVGFDAVIEYYADAERVGGVTRADYYLPLSRFMVFGRLKAFHEGTLILLSRQKAINGYLIIMNNAIKYSKAEDRAVLEEEKRRNVAYFETELMKYPEHQTVFRAGRYIATAVYSSYDCPQVWVLRRFRDQRLSKSLFGRLFIKLYYTISPTFVAVFGSKSSFKKLFKPLLDKLVHRLQLQGIEDTPYEDSAK